ncbi:MAG: hypothetical protein U1F66_10910 [bacterium]
MTALGQAGLATEIPPDSAAELCPVLPFPSDRAPDPSLARSEVSWEEEEEPTTVESIRKIPVPSPFQQFLFSPHYQTALSQSLHRYLGQVRARMKGFRELHRAQFPDSGMAKLRRLMNRALAHAKANLAVK